MDLIHLSLDGIFAGNLIELLLSWLNLLALYLLLKLLNLVKLLLAIAELLVECVDIGVLGLSPLFDLAIFLALFLGGSSCGIAHYLNLCY